AFLKFIWHLLDRHVKAASAHLRGDRFEVTRTHRPQSEQRKNADFVCHATHLGNRRGMKSLVELLRIEEEEVRTQCEIERSVNKRQRRQLTISVTSLHKTRRVIIEKFPHRRHAHFS